MLQVIEVKDGLHIKSWCKPIEDGALEQAENLARHPRMFRHIALMPDCHVGYGMPIGGVIACENAIIPNAVGVDIACGMMAVKTNLTLGDMSPDTIKEILHSIKRDIPVGMGGSHQDRSRIFKENKENYNYQTWDGYNELVEVCGFDQESSLINFIAQNLGTLGSNNHFISLEKDQENNIWFMIHSGSRGLGYKIAKYWHKVAVNLNEKWNSNIPHKDLSFLPLDTPEGQGYLDHMIFAMRFAQSNRNKMCARIENTLRHTFGDTFKELDRIHINHNYARQEHHYGRDVWVHRKGATSARKGEMGIIPGSMGTSSYIVEGLGNPESFCSCSHGAGRTMSRTKANEMLSQESCEADMDGIVFGGFQQKRGRGKKAIMRTDLSESPAAYKNIDEVMANQTDLVKIVHKLTPIGVIKG